MKRTYRRPSYEIRRILAYNLRSFRVANNISQEELANRCGLHRTYIGSVERAERNVTLSTLEALASVLGISVPDIMTKRESDEA